MEIPGNTYLSAQCQCGICVKTENILFDVFDWSFIYKFYGVFIYNSNIRRKFDFELIKTDLRDEITATISLIVSGNQRRYYKMTFSCPTLVWIEFSSTFSSWNPQCSMTIYYVWCLYSICLQHRPNRYTVYIRFTADSVANQRKSKVYYFKYIIHIYSSSGYKYISIYIL